MKNDDPFSIVLIDGQCLLCQSATKFIVHHDPVGRFYFASLQSETGQRLLGNVGLPLDHISTFVLIEGDRYFTQSTAALRIARHLRGLWPLTYGIILLPRFIRDTVYQYIARNRYRWFGQSDQCMLPTSDLKGRLLE
ncbi:thiol-disulfide oxidoreductase DCC family protein [Paenibacillus crassostreae]|uniref:Thiol-disulfide oxidoreductase DCC n=1 Tax=Paenibacillus crassostreae TaxID=1763538 RepID=A0A167GKY3_9BACL|nr:DCC1-like thiol-disulfide oxidoreductase family protein [Paenibacillus crassostreae]AOZ92208.1 thiol-disulfide oxidoreductase DCC [Paenibacillus crassostreae]OAB77670.1 thiol-disulfide oxidoreductase DCC [Paenibacillus crassostreae]